MASLTLDVSNFGTSYVNSMQVRTIGNNETSAQNAYGLSIYAGASQSLFVTVGATYSINVSGDLLSSVSGNSVLSTTGNLSNAVSGNASKSVTGSLTAKSDGAYSVGSTSGAVAVSAGTSVSVSAGSSAALSAVTALDLSSASYSLTTSAAAVETVGAAKTVTVGATYTLTAVNACSVASTGQMVLASHSSFLSASAATDVSISAGASADVLAGTSASLKSSNGALVLGSTGGAVNVSAAGGNLKLDSMTGLINIGTEAVNEDINIGTAGVRTIRIGATGGDVEIIPDFTIGGSLTVNGDLNLKGKTNQYEINTLMVADKTIVLNEGLNSDLTADGGGLSLLGTTGSHSWLWELGAGVEGTHIWESNDSSVNVPTGQLYQINKQKALSESQLCVKTTVANGGLYMNGLAANNVAVAGDWRIRQTESNGVQVLLFERYDADSSSWVSRFRLN